MGTMEFLMKRFDDTTARYSAREHVCASFIQEFVRTRSLVEAMAARSAAKEKMNAGVQFAQRVSWGLEGNEHFELGIVRGRVHLNRECIVGVEASSAGLTDVRPGVDYELLDSQVRFEPGERFAIVRLSLLNNGVSTSGTSVWLPVRELKLTLHLVAEMNKSGDDPILLGDASVCHVKIVDSDKWPANKKDTYVAQSLFGLFVRQTLKGSLEEESWWFVGMLIRSISGTVLKPLLVMLLFDLAIRQRSLDWAFIVGAGWLTCHLVDHITSYWYHAGGNIGYNMSLTWLLAKWSELPLSKAANVDVIARYRGTIDLITSSFFGDNNYSVFASLVTTYVNIACIILSPMLLFNLVYCSDSEKDGDGECMTTDYVRMAYDPTTFSLSLVPALGTVAMVSFYKVVDAVSPTRYEREVHRYIRMQARSAPPHPLPIAHFLLPPLSLTCASVSDSAS